MKRSKNLVFQTEKQHSRLKLRRFTAVLLSVLILGGAASVLYFLKNYNFNLSSAFGKTSAETETHAEASTAAQPSKASRSVLLFCSDSGRKELRFVCLLRAEVPDFKITLLSLSPQTEASVGSASKTFNEFFRSGGAPKLLKAVQAATGVEPDGYLFSDDEQFKTVVNHFGGFTIPVDAPVEYRGNDFTLLLPKGNQTMKGDSLLKYFRYLLLNGDSGMRLQAEIIRKMLETMLTAARSGSIGNDYSYLANHLSTNITIVDFSAASAGIEAMMNSGKISYVIVTSADEFSSEQND